MKSLFYWNLINFPGWFEIFFLTAFFKAEKKKNGTLILAEMKNYLYQLPLDMENLFQTFHGSASHKLFIMYYKLHITCNIKIK